MSLTPRTVHTAVARAMRQALILGAQQRLPPVADIAALRAMDPFGAGTTFQYGNEDLVYVEDEGTCFQWSTASQAADDGSTVIAPTAAGTTGRWIRASSSIRLASTFLHQLQVGYVRDVRIAYGRWATPDLDADVPVRPAYVINPQEDDPQTLSPSDCALYDFHLSVDIWTLGDNFRPDALGALGSPVPGDPDGVNYLDGLAWEILAGSGNLGLPGDVQTVFAGRGWMERQDYDQRRFTRVRRYGVIATVANTANDGDLQAPVTLLVSPLDAQGDVIGDPYLVPRP